MKKNAWLLPAGLLAAALAVLLLGARRDLNEPHLRLFSDMVRTPAYHSQSSNPIFRDGETEQAPPPGTIPRDFHPLHFTPDEAGRELAGRQLKNPFLPSFENMARGRQMFEAFCSHCHGVSGLGDGAVAKLFPQFSFPLATQSTYNLPDGTIFHIMTYGRNLMPPVRTQLSQADRWKVILYLRDLQRQEIARMGPRAFVPQDPRRNTLVSDAYGKELFAINCASCHGEEGLHPKPGIPTLHLPAVLAYAGDSYYWDIINHGRPGTQMPAWREILTPTQIKSIVLHIRSWAGPTPQGALLAGGAAARGSALFATHCIGCHGPEGRGGIGPSLSSPSFLAMASDQFLRETISLGRHHTAMPASYDLTPQDVSSLVAYIRSWARKPPAWKVVAALRAEASPAAGRALFTARCSACHGPSGEGAIGSALNSQSFLAMADDRFLYNVITEGRPGTAMPAWTFLSARDVANVISYIRSWQKAPSVALSTATRPGQADFGQVLFAKNCASCHGPQGGGDIGTQIANPILLTQEKDDFLWRTIAYGKDGTEMKGFLKRARDPLSSEDIGHLVAYLRKMQHNPPPQGLLRTYSWASAKDGLAVYQTKAGCVQCHGVGGSGASGPSLGNPAFLKVASNGYLYGTIVLGREGTAMHSYYNGADRPHLEEADIENVIAYLRSLETSPAFIPRRVERGPKLVAAGHALFEQNCARCHGRQGLGKHGLKPGDFAPSLNNQEFLKAADDNFLLATIALGRPGTPMRAFGDGMDGKPGLTAEQIREIVAFLRSWQRGQATARAQ